MDLSTWGGEAAATWVTGIAAVLVALYSTVVSVRLHRANERAAQAEADKSRIAADAHLAAEQARTDALNAAALARDAARAEHEKAMQEAAQRHSAEISELNWTHQEHLISLRDIEEGASKVQLALRDFHDIVGGAATAGNRDLLLRARVATDRLTVVANTVESLAGRIKPRHRNELSDYVDLLTLVMLDLTRRSEQRSAPEYAGQMSIYSELVRRMRERVPWLVQSYRDPQRAVISDADPALRKDVRAVLDKLGMKSSRLPSDRNTTPLPENRAE